MTIAFPTLRTAGSVAAFALAMALTLPLDSSVARAEDAANPVVARVNGQEIHRSDVDEARTRLPAQLRGAPAKAIYPLIINSLVDTQLVAAKARASGLQDDPAVKRNLTRIEDQLLERTLLARYLKERLTDDVLKARYETWVATQTGQKEARARHILVETEDQAKAIITELGKGVDFAELARSRSIGPSGPKGGDLGYFKDGEMVPAFSQAVFTLDKGGVTESPVKTQFGWHVIKVEDKRDAQPPSFEEAVGDIRAEASRELVSGYIRQLRSEAEIELFNPDGSPIQKK